MYIHQKKRKKWSDVFQNRTPLIFWCISTMLTGNENKEEKSGGAMARKIQELEKKLKQVPKQCNKYKRRYFSFTKQQQTANPENPESPGSPATRVNRKLQGQSVISPIKKKKHWLSTRLWLMNWEQNTKPPERQRQRGLLPQFRQGDKLEETNSKNVDQMADNTVRNAMSPWDAKSCAYGDCKECEPPNHHPMMRLLWPSGVWWRLTPNKVKNLRNKAQSLSRKMWL